MMRMEKEHNTAANTNTRTFSTLTISSVISAGDLALVALRLNAPARGWYMAGEWSGGESVDEMREEERREVVTHPHTDSSKTGRR